MKQTNNLGKETGIRVPDLLLSFLARPLNTFCLPLFFTSLTLSHFLSLEQQHFLLLFAST